MDDLKVNEVLKTYEELLRDTLGNLRDEKFEHIKQMLPKIRGFIDAGRKEKAMRWLGFIQGALWCLGIYSIEDLKNHNRPKSPSPREMNGRKRKEKDNG